MIIILRADYDQMAEISKRFEREAANVKRSIDNLNRTVEVLKGGDWIGEGAEAFYREMESEVMPAMQRLVKALELASRATRQIGQILQEAEEECSHVWSQTLSSIGDAGAADFRRAGDIAMGELSGQGALAGAGTGGPGGAGGSEPEKPASGGGGGGAGGGAGGGGSGGGGGGGSWDGEIGFQQEKPEQGAPGKPPARPRRR